MEADRSRPSAFTLVVSGTEQSYVDLDDPGRIEFDYVQRMADVLDLHLSRPRDDEEARRVVHVGGAGLSLPRFVASRHTRTPQVVLEPDTVLTGFVREHLPLPPRSGIKVRDVAGRPGLEAMRDDFADVVVLDAFDGAQVPPDLTTAECVATVRRVLTSDGLFLLNLTDTAPFAYVRRVVATLGRSFSHVGLSAEPATLKGRRFGNVLAVASGEALPVEEMTRVAARSMFPYRVMGPADVRRTFHGGAVLTDADPQHSPAPPGGPGVFR
ncbi:fused MFS/spermidine synthase [Aeromicrobium sp. Root495]|uniref:spermidine synthase n=1 Tax=Aeromicrobium sp. Root495 TaxID=1736550 RepID=UPI0012E7BF6C